MNYHWIKIFDNQTELESLIPIKTIIVFELRNEKNTRIYSIAPGVVDTSMQEQIRRSDKHSFSNLARFTELKELNQLDSAENVAKKIISFMFSENPFKNGRYDIREL